MDISCREEKDGLFVQFPQRIKTLFAKVMDNIAVLPNKVRKALFPNVMDNIVRVSKKVKNIWQDYRRRIIHSFKVGLTLTLVTLIYYLQPLYDAFGVNGIWAVITVILVFEYYVGATLIKVVNRVFATLLACALAVGAVHLASLWGQRGEPIILGAFVILLVDASTFLRFLPSIKASYDYGVLVFILTFCLITVSGYRVDDMKMAYQRLSTIAIGCFTCGFISMFFCPVWAGEDLQNSVALNMEIVAKFLEGFGEEFFKKEEGENVGDDDSKEDKSFLHPYKDVLNSKSSEESLANFARWEPGHGRFRFRHPWNQYLKIGSLVRQCACSLDALNACINSKFQAPVEFQEKFQDTCINMSRETGKALMELALAIRTMTKPTSATPYMANAKSAATNLRAALKITPSENTVLLEILPAATVAFLLVEIVSQTEKIAEAIVELSHAANFKNSIVVIERPSSHHQDLINSKRITIRFHLKIVSS